MTDNDNYNDEDNAGTPDLSNLSNALKSADALSGKFNAILGTPSSATAPGMQPRAMPPNNGSDTDTPANTMFSIKQGISTPSIKELRANTFSQNTNLYTKEKDRLMDRFSTFTIDVTGVNGKYSKFKATADRFRARSDVPMVVTAAMDVINEHSKMLKEYDRFFMYTEQWNSRQCDVIDTLKTEIAERDTKLSGAMQTNGRLKQLLDSMTLYIAKDNLKDSLPIKYDDGTPIYSNVVANIQKQLAGYESNLEFFKDYKDRKLKLEAQVKELTAQIDSQSRELAAKDKKITELNSRYVTLETEIGSKLNTLCGLSQAQPQTHTVRNSPAHDDWPEDENQQIMPVNTNSSFTSFNPIRSAPVQVPLTSPPAQATASPIPDNTAINSDIPDNGDDDCEDGSTDGANEHEFTEVPEHIIDTDPQDISTGDTPPVHKALDPQIQKKMTASQRAIINKIFICGECTKEELIWAKDINPNKTLLERDLKKMVDDKLVTRERSGAIVIWRLS